MTATAQKKNQQIDFISELSEALAGTRVKKETGVIEGVVLLTGEKVSKNKTFYTKKALQEARTRYEGAKMFLDHPKAGEMTRSVRDFGGSYRNVRIEEGNKLKADLHLVPNQAIRDIVIPIAESSPVGVALSIKDKGYGKDENGIFLVEGFAARASFSIDLVADASVNETLFESNQGGEDMDKKEVIASLTLEELQEGNKALVESIRSTERTAALKELEEKVKAGEDAPKILAKAKKMLILAESALPQEIVAKLKPIVEADACTAESADAMVKAQKDILEAMKPATKKEPVITGHGASTKKETPLAEGELPSEEELAEALVG